MIYKARNFSYKTPAETRVFTSEQLGKGQINEFSPFYNSLKTNGFRNRRFFYEKSMGEFSEKHDYCQKSTSFSSKSTSEDA